MSEAEPLRKTPMRVLMLSKACVAGIYQPKLEAIAAGGVDLLVLTPPSWIDERGEQKLERAHDQGYELRAIPIRFNGNFHLHHYPSLGSEMRRFQPNVVHIDEEPYNLATWQALYHARRAGAKALFFSWQNIKRRYPPPFRFGEAWVYRRCDYALAGTDDAASVLREKGYRGSMRVIPQFGSDPVLFQPSPSRPQRPFTVGFIGRVVAEKGVETLLRAFARLGDAPRLRFVGGGPALDDMRSLAREMGFADRVRFTGQLPSHELPAQFHALDVLVLPSLTRPNWKEQFGRVLVEAMASGVPVIGSDSGAIPGVIGEAGIVLPEGDVDALARSLRQLQDSSDLRDDLARRGRGRFLTHFTHEKIAAATVEVYRELMAPTPGASGE